MLDKSDTELIQHTTDGYNTIADEWHQTRQEFWPEIADTIKQNISGNENIIDVGCGNGRLLKILSSYPDIKYFGIDPSEKLIDYAREDFPDNKFEICDGINIPAKNEEYDICFSIAVMHHLPTSLVAEWLSEIHRVLKPDAKFICTLWDLENSKSYPLLQNGDGLLPFRAHKDIRYVHAYTKQEIKKYFNESGFEILSMQNIKRESGEGNIVIVSQRHV